MVSAQAWRETRCVEPSTVCPEGLSALALALDCRALGFDCGCGCGCGCGCDCDCGCSCGCGCVCGLWAVAVKGAWSTLLFFSVPHLSIICWWWCCWSCWSFLCFSSVFSSTDFSHPPRLVARTTSDSTPAHLCSFALPTDRLLPRASFVTS
jgi:hypothetical protein